MAPLGASDDGDARRLNAELCYAIAEGKLDAVERVLEMRADVTFGDFEGRTPLHVAAATHAGEAVVQKLLELKASPDAVDVTKATPLDRALQVGYGGFASLLGQRPDLDIATPAETNIHDESHLILQNGEKEQWALRHDEVVMGASLGSTLKSDVFKGQWRGTEVAIKRIKMGPPGDGQLDEDGAALQRELLHEVKILSKMRHPDLVLFLGVCLEKAPFMLLMEYMPGGDLQRYYIKKRKELNAPYKPPVAKALQWLSAVARGLCFLHEARIPIVHRDLKPLNLLLTRSEELKVTDFGISKAVSRNIQGTRVQRAMTRGVGTYLYMAPEVVRTDSYDAKADIYSFALIMYFVTSGYEPFHGDFKSSEEILKAYCDGKAPRPRAAECPSWVRSIMKESWSEEPSERPSAYDITHQFAGIHAPSTCNCSIS